MDVASLFSVHTRRLAIMVHLGGQFVAFSAQPGRLLFAAFQQQIPEFARRLCFSRSPSSRRRSASIWLVLTQLHASNAPVQHAERSSERQMLAF